MKEAKAQKDLWDELRAAEAALDAAERRFDQAADELKFARKNVSTKRFQVAFFGPCEVRAGLPDAAELHGKE
jgi:Tfp pilus assembly protein PilX